MIGKFQHRMRAQSLTTQNDGFDDDAPDLWEDFQQEMFALKPTRGDEVTSADTLQSQTTHTGTCHWFAGANSEMRLKMGERIFHVESVFNQFERNMFLEWKLIEVYGGD